MTTARAARTSILLLLCLLSASHVYADPLISRCQSLVEDDAERFVCQVRSTAGRELSNFEVKTDDGQLLDISARPYSWQTDQTAIYFLVQTAEVSKATLERFATYLTRAAYPVGNQSMGIAVAGVTFDQEAQLGSYRPRLNSVADDIGAMNPVEGTTVVLRSLSDAISRVANVNADRKAIIVLSDPAPSSNKVDENTIINQALNQNIAIYFAVQGDAGSSPSSLIKSIAEKTNGGIIELTGLSEEDLLKQASRAPEGIENGAILDFEAAQLAETASVTISASAQGDGTLTTAPITLKRQTSDFAFSPAKLFKDHLYETIAALLLLSGLSLLLLSKRNTTQATATPGAAYVQEQTDDETRILTQNWSAGQEAAAVAWLDLVDSSEPPLPLAPGSIRIGRSRDNDVQLTNRSVHRHHAILQVSDSGSVSIQDLGTKNGVFVNGSRCNECALCVDDVVELGEVKLRLTTKPGSA